ncbi:MAG: DUF1847 domain-containing protein [Deltaproteobacteria bacterium]|nr:DUF1847 domain-containing protein [Deltaproteobacteria bacterium]
MVCRTHARDCHDVHDASVSVYHNSAEMRTIAQSASALVDNGRAGTLNRIEEIIEYCYSRKYSTVGVAYCFGLKDLAIEFCEMLEAAGLTVAPVSCTSGAVLERQIDPSKSNDAVSCNPVGQALVLNRTKPDIVVEMGLCLGHDMIFRQTLDIPLTVLVVKDRTVAHHTASLFSSYVDANTSFIQNLDDSFAMKSPNWLREQIDTNSGNMEIVDLRSSAAYEKNHIPGSINIPLRVLPLHAGSLNLRKHIVCVCNGSVQSAYAIMFLYSRGFRNVHNLSGGFSGWEREGFGTTSSIQ